MDKSGSLTLRGNFLRTPANNNLATPRHIALLEHVEGVGEVPMISTANFQVQRMISIVRRIIIDTLNAHDSDDKPVIFKIEFFDSSDLSVEEPEQKVKPVKIPRGSEYIGEYFGQKGFRRLEAVPEKIYTIEEIHKELLALSEWQITFYSVVEVLLKRWFRQSQVYFQDRQVATLVKHLLDETQRKKVLNLLQSFEFGVSDPHF